MKRFALGVLALVAGCCPSVVDLPDRYRPLERLENDTADPGVYHAFGSVLKGSTCDFMQRPQKEQEGLLLHEQRIAAAQLAYPGGVDAYVKRCGSDRDFLAREELDAWQIQIVYETRSGVAVDRLGIAQFLASRYWPPVDYTAALNAIDQWIAQAKGEK